MSDDIVTRLRRKSLDSGKHPYISWDDIGMLEGAADEIEHLREAMRLMYAHYHADNGAELVAVYEKSVRGE